MAKNSPVVHFEMPYKDAKRASKFYEEVFGWQMNNSGPKMGDYILAITTEVDPKTQRPIDGGINGGFYPIASSKYPEPSIVISVDNLEEAIKKLLAAGGEILSEPTDIPGVGRWASFRDSEDNRVSILQPKM